LFSRIFHVTELRARAVCVAAAVCMHPGRREPWARSSHVRQTAIRVPHRSLQGGVRPHDLGGGPSAFLSLYLSCTCCITHNYLPVEPSSSFNFFSWSFPCPSKFFSISFANYYLVSISSHAYAWSIHCTARSLITRQLSSLSRV
jgi:hypothetical protein